MTDENLNLLSYQHAYHAGNHADVLKHLCLISVLRKLTIKAKPLFYLDTHAGEGAYSLQDAAGIQNNEYQQGVQALVSRIGELNSVRENRATQDALQTNESLDRYLKLVTDFIQNGQYPGSPLVADSILRGGDRAHAIELHPSASLQLKRVLRDSHFSAHQRNGFEALNAFMPPKPNRGAVLIDPPYEQKEEYQEVFEAVSNSLKKWPNGCFIIWYPLLSPTRIDKDSMQIVDSPKAGMSERMLNQLAGLPAKSALKIEFAQNEPNSKVGMYGSGVCVINPPWQLDIDLNSILNIMQELVPTTSSELCQLTWLKTES